jgi:LacI family transcriptional regulator
VRTTPVQRPGGRDTTIAPVHPPTLRDVAKVAGVHPATASRALNPATRGLVNADTARKVIKAAESLGYQPNPIARSLKTSKSNTIGVVIPDLTNPLFPPIVRGIEDVLTEARYSAWLVNTDNDPARERVHIDSLRSRQVEGLILATARLQHPLLDDLHAQGVRMVLINRRTSSPDIPFVSADDQEGIALAVRHLVQLGHRRIAHLAGPQSTSTGVARRKAFRHALRDDDLDENPELLINCGSWTESAGAKATQQLLETGANFTAVVAGNDLIALGCYDVFAERGIRCPEDVSVVGFNNMPYLDKLRIPLTTVSVPHYAIGVEAARMLLSTINQPDQHPRSVLLPPSLVIRASTGPPPS